MILKIISFIVYRSVDVTSEYKFITVSVNISVITFQRWARHKVTHRPIHVLQCSGRICKFASVQSRADSNNRLELSINSQRWWLRVRCWGEVEGGECCCGCWQQDDGGILLEMLSGVSAACVDQCVSVVIGQFSHCFTAHPSVIPVALLYRFTYLYAPAGARLTYDMQFSATDPSSSCSTINSLIESF